MSLDEISPPASPLELIKHLGEKLLPMHRKKTGQCTAHTATLADHTANALLSVIMADAGVRWVKKGRDGWESGREKVQIVGYTLTCGPPLFPLACTLFNAANECVCVDYVSLKA